MFCAMETPRSFFNPRTDAFYPPDAAHHHGQQAPPPPSSAYNSYPRTLNSYDDHLYPPSSQPAPPWHNDHLVPAATTTTQTATVTRHASSSSASSSPGLAHNHHSQDPYDSSTPSPPPSAPTSLSSSAMSSQPVQKTYSFIPLQGNAVRKRPRRRYDEIERLYSCNFPGCNKSYGTLNHLNAHVTMQKHGEKRSPNEFKEMRKQWRKQKKDEQDRAAAEATYASLVAAGNAPELTINTTPPSAQRIVTASLASSASLASPLSLGYPSPNDYSPVDSDVGGHHSAHTPPQHVPRRMSLPNLALGLDAGSQQQQQQPQHHHHHQHSPQSYHHLPPAGMALPSLSLSTAQHEYWRSADSDAPSSGSSTAGYPVPTRSPADYPRSAVHDAYRDPAAYRHEYVPQSAPPHQVAFSHSVHHPSLPDPVTVSHQDDYAHAHPAVRDPYIHLGGGGGHHDE